MDTKKLKLNDLVYELNNKEDIVNNDNLLIVVNGVADNEIPFEKIFFQPEKRRKNIKGYSILQHMNLIDGFFMSGDDKISLYNERNKEHILFKGIRSPQIQMNDIIPDEKFVNSCLKLLTKLKQDEKIEELDDIEKETIEEVVEDSKTNVGGNEGTEDTTDKKSKDVVKEIPEDVVEEIPEDVVKEIPEDVEIDTAEKDNIIEANTEIKKEDIVEAIDTSKLDI